jgi:flavodoxin I
MDQRIAILYGPTGGNTEKVARLIHELIGEKSYLMPIKDIHPDVLISFKNIIIGGSTVGTHTWKHNLPSKDWETFLPLLRKMDFTGKKIALFGLGDNVSYPNNFVDDLRILFDAVTDINGTLVGQCSTDGYEFTDSEAVIDDEFVGLPIDENNESHLTLDRLKNWIEKLLPQFK